MTLYRRGEMLRNYRVALGRGGMQPKSMMGDNRVPEGIYRISGRNSQSSFHRALHIGYPTAEQTARAHTQGVNPGGDVMIHGIQNGLGWIGSAHRLVDWTKGCIAVTDVEMDEIWKLVPDGTIIEIRS